MATTMITTTTTMMTVTTTTTMMTSTTTTTMMTSTTTMTAMTIMTSTVMTTVTTTTTTMMTSTTTMTEMTLMMSMATTKTIAATATRATLMILLTTALKEVVAILTMWLICGFCSVFLFSQGRKLIVIGTTSCRDVLETMGIVESFNTVIHVPSLSSTDHLRQVLQVGWNYHCKHGLLATSFVYRLEIKIFINSFRKFLRTFVPCWYFCFCFVCFYHLSCFASFH